MYTTKKYVHRETYNQQINQNQNDQIYYRQIAIKLLKPSKNTVLN